MILTIRQAKNIIVNKGDDQFVFVKRKLGLKVVSEFYKNEELIFESSLYTVFLKQIVDIKFQHLPDFVSIERTKGWYYSLLYNNTTLSIKVKYFRRPAFLLFKDGKEVGSIGNTKLIAVEGRNYQMNMEIEDETTNLYFIILFLSQLRGF